MPLTSNIGTEPIILGSGELYIAKSKDISNLASPTDTDLSKFVNIGAISGNASLTIKDDFTDIESTNRGIIDSLLKKRTVSFNTGIITFNLENLAKFIYGADYADDAENKIKTVSIGNEVADKCYIKFVHTDKASGDKFIVNIPQSRFAGEQSFEFGEDATVTNYEFKALATLVNGKTKYFMFENHYSDNTAGE